MGSLNRRPLLLVVAATVLSGLLVGWFGGVVSTGLGVPGPLGVVSGVALFVALLVVVWLAFEGRRTAG